MTDLTLALVLTPIAVLQADEVFPALTICQAICQLRLQRQVPLQCCITFVSTSSALV